MKRRPQQGSVLAALVLAALFVGIAADSRSGASHGELIGIFFLILAWSLAVLEGVKRTL